MTVSELSGINTAATGSFQALTDGSELVVSGQNLSLFLGDLINSDNDVNGETYTLRLLAREGLVRPDGVPTDTGRAQAAKVARDERRWEVAREIHQDAGLTGRYDGLTPIEEVFTADEVAEFDRRLGPPVAMGGT